MKPFLCSIAALLLVAAAPQDRRGKYPRGGGPKEGEAAPDFKLKQLLKNDSDRTGTAEFVKLSSFKDKQPVVLIFGSYT